MTNIHSKEQSCSSLKVPKKVPLILSIIMFLKYFFNKLLFLYFDTLNSGQV